MSSFDTETAVTHIGNDRWAADVSERWNIGDNPNGGYLVATVVRALREVAAHPDPISVTTHFLRPATGGEPADVHTELIRTGRTISTARATLVQGGTARLEVLAAFGDLSASSAVDHSLTIAMPSVPGPGECASRSDAEQGIALPILERLDIMIVPGSDSVARTDGIRTAEVTGWIRLGDGADPDVLALLLFADAFPPSLFGLLGAVGWVPSIELTVHVRRRPVAGWVLGQFSTSDLDGGRMIESGALWDSSGALVAQSRQIGLLLPR